MGLLRQILLVIFLSSCLNLVSAKWEFNWTNPFVHRQDDHQHGYKIVPSSAATLSVRANGDFVCTYKGRFPNPSDCSAYYLCAYDFSGKLFLTYMTCPGNLVFNPHSQFCTSPDKYNCVPTTTTPIPTPNECESEGNFPYPGDCTKYYMCISVSPGNFLKVDMTCPEPTFFNPDPAVSACTRDYVCPIPPCNDGGFLCASASSFYECDPNNVPIEQVQNCPAGTFCYMNCRVSCVVDVNFC